MADIITPRYIVRRCAIDFGGAGYATPGQELELILDWRKKSPYVEDYANSYDSLIVSAEGGGVTFTKTSDTPSGIRWAFTAPATTKLINIRIVSSQYDLNAVKLKTFDHTYGALCQVGEKPDVEIPESIDTTVVVDGVPTPITYPIDPTGTVNSSAGLNAFFASRPYGLRIIPPAGATYRSEHKVKVQSRWGYEIVDLMLLTESIQTKDEDPLRAKFKQLEFVAGGDHIVRNLRTNGARPVGERTYTEEFETWHSIATAGVNRIKIIDPILTNPHGDFINPGFLVMDGFEGLHNNWPTWDMEISGSYSLVDAFGFLTGAEGIIGGYMDNSGRMGVGMTGNPRLWAHHLKMGNVQRSLWDPEPGDVSMWSEAVVVEHIRIFGRIRNNWLANAGAGRYIDGMAFGWMAGTGSPIRCDINGAINRNVIYLHDFKSLDTLKSSNSPFEISGWTDPRVENMEGVIQAGRDAPAVLLLNVRGTPIVENVNFANQRVMWRREEVTGAKVIKTEADNIWHYIVQQSGGNGLDFIPGEPLTFTVRAITGAVLVSTEEGFIRFNAISSQKPQNGSVVTGTSSGATAVLGAYVHRSRTANIFRITEDDVVIYGDAEAPEPEPDPEDEPPAPVPEPGSGDVALVRRARLIKTVTGYVGAGSSGSLVTG